MMDNYYLLFSALIVKGKRANDLELCIPNHGYHVRWIAIVEIYRSKNIVVGTKTLNHTELIRNIIYN